MTPEEMLSFLKQIFPQGAAEIQAELDRRARLLEVVTSLKEKVACLPSSDELQTILRGILVLIKLIIEREA